ncbi:MAG: tetratricopeptide repeat protein [Bacteroidota bacterium]|nr:tetratricopeptide repeat protein [Bacteroidota bacterium]
MKTNTRILYSFFKQCFLVALLLGLQTSCKTKPPVAAEPAVAKQGGTQKKVLSDKEKQDFEYLFIEGSKEWILKNYDLAEVKYSQALRIDPNSAVTMYELARVYAFQNNKNQALFYSKRAATLEPKNTWFQLLYADCLKENKQFDEVAEVFTRIIKDNPERIDFYYELAGAYLYGGKPGEAIKVYNKIEQRIGVTEDVSMQKLKVYKAIDNFEKAVEEAEKLIKAYPKEAKYYGMLGELYQDKGQDDKAFAAYTELLKIDPNNAYVHLSLADYYRNKKENEKAFEEIKIAFRARDLDIDTKIKILLSYYSITETYIDLKPDAEELCRIIVEVHPDEAKAFAMYGDFLYRDKKFEEARVQYRKAISLDKEKYTLWNYLLLIDSDLADFTSLEKDSKEAMELFPNQSLPYFFNGVANAQLKQYKAAIASFLEGKEFVYDNRILLGTFYQNIGDAYNQLKNHPASDSAYNKALELDPDNVYVLNNYAYYLSLRGVNLAKAEAMSKRCNELEPNTSSYQDTYGWILYQMKKYDDAKVWVGKAVDNGGGSNGTLLEHYGDILYQLGDTTGALNYWINAKKFTGTSGNIDKKISDKKLYE